MPIFKSIVEHFDAIIVFDNNDGKLIYKNSEVNTIIDQELENIEEFNNFIISNTDENTLIIYDTIKLNNTSYLLRRKKVQDYILFHFEDNNYVSNLINNIKQENTIDDLTSCYNKKETELIFRRMLSTYLRYKETYFTVIMFDIDYFKKVNDTYGHLAGDFVLKELTQLIRGHLRDSDVFGRVGGEEFTLLLSQTKLNGAIKLANKIRNFVQEYEFVFQEQLIPITISLGVTSINTTDSYFSIVDRADKALYKAKRTGRNKVEYL